MRRQEPARRHLVLVGGGHSHVTVIRALGMSPEPGLMVTVIAKEVEAPYSGMLPGLVAGHYSHAECHIDVAQLATWAGSRFIHASATGIDRARREVLIDGRAPLPYDVLAIDIGITPDIGGIRGAAEHAIAVKPVSTFTDRWTALEARALERDGPRRIVVVGSGAAGFELILAVRHRLVTACGAQSGFTFALVGDRLLARHNTRARTLARAELARQGVDLVEGERVVAIDPGTLRFDSGRKIAADAVLVSTKAAPAPWLRRSGLPCDEHGFLAVRPTLQLLDDDDVFATGDCATVLEHPREKAGVFAVRQGPPLADNIRRRLRGEAARPFVPQKQFLTLLSAGRKHAIASRGPLAISGGWVWAWKDNIDRKFMAMFQDLPPMPDIGSGDEIRCGGCAAKVGPAALTAALDRLGAGIPREDAAIFDDGGPMLRLETTDFFRAPWPEPYLFGEIAAVHALSDIYAMGGTPTHALANAVLPYAAPARTAADLHQLLAGAKAAFDRDGVSIAGGHSSEGAELAAGFFVSGTVSRDAVLRKSGLRPGDRLVLTRPIGSGILLAALMRGHACGRAVTDALRIMRASNRVAARILAAHGATAATDVTGFGLAGHLIEMLDASQCDADIALPSVPLYDGALALARDGVASTLLAENLALAARIDGAERLDDPTLALLFDPQTSGGLLAGVPQARVADCLAALEAGGLPWAADIGTASPSMGGLPRVRLAGRIGPRG